MKQYKVEKEYKKSGKRGMSKRTKWASIYLKFNDAYRVLKMVRCKKYKTDWRRAIVEAIEELEWRYDKPSLFYTVEHFNLHYNADLQILENMYNIIKTNANAKDLTDLPILPQRRL